MVVCTNDVRWPSLIGEGRDEERERERNCCCRTVCSGGSSGHRSKQVTGEILLRQSREVGDRTAEDEDGGADGDAQW